MRHLTVLSIFFISASLLFYVMAKVLPSSSSKPCPVSERQYDSLQSEIFVNQTIVMRYQLALDMLKERDSVAAKKFEEILYTETE